MGEPEERLALNEALFRELNERVTDGAESMGEAVFEVYCECANLDCIDRVAVTADEYRRVRSDPTQFIVRVGHEAAGVEEVVFSTDRFEIVRKRGRTGGVTTLLEP